MMVKKHFGEKLRISIVLSWAEYVELDGIIAAQQVSNSDQLILLYCQGHQKLR